jgi:hypothetical protein
MPGVFAVYVAIATGFCSLLLFLFTKHIERMSVNKALLAEIQRLLDVVKQHYVLWGRWIADGETKKHPLIPFSTDIYTEHVKSIGLVDRESVGMVVKFYGYLKFVNAFQNTQLREWELHEGDPTSFDRMYNASLERLVREFDEAFEESFKKYGLLKESRFDHNQAG